MQASKKPKVLTGGLYKDVWYAAGGKSWMAQFIYDANADYYWSNDNTTGAIPLGIEAVLEKATEADIWLNPSMHTTYADMNSSNLHYRRFSAFTNEQVFSNSIKKGPTGGLLFYELASLRPDIVLKDLVKIFHPEILPEHKFFFFAPLQ